MIDLERMLERLPSQAADSVIGMLRPKSQTLARYLRETWSAPPGRAGVTVPFSETRARRQFGDRRAYSASNP